MNKTKTYKILMGILFAVMFFAINFNLKSQNVSVNNETVDNSSTNNTNVITIENPNQEKQPVDNSNKITVPVETPVYPKEELTGGNWVLTGTEAKSYNMMNITKWQTDNNNEIQGNCSWKDKIEIIHSVESGFRWQDPPKMMQPGSYMNIEAVYTNIDYSTTAQINTGIRMFFARSGSDFKNPDASSVDVLKLNKDNKHYANEVKKGFFYAPNTLFDETNTCQLYIDCYIGKDHFVTTYTYTYQK